MSAKPVDAWLYVWFGVGVDSLQFQLCTAMFTLYPFVGFWKPGHSNQFALEKPEYICLAYVILDCFLHPSSSYVFKGNVRNLSCWCISSFSGHTTVTVIASNCIGLYNCDSCSQCLYVGMCLCLVGSHWFLRLCQRMKWDYLKDQFVWHSLVLPSAKFSLGLRLTWTIYAPDQLSVLWSQKHLVNFLKTHEYV